MAEQNITVTKVFLPPLENYYAYLKGIWERGHITNHGPLVNELETELKTRTGVPYVYFLNNGTIAIQIAIKALDLTGEVITTPFSYVATTSSIIWEQCKPVFVDIESTSLTIDAAKIEAAITPQTSAILATHVFGNPCDVEAIADIAARHNLKVIYDAAHAFDINYKGKSLLQYGDVSTLSFHATKLFHTTEGGAVLTNNPNIAHKLSFMRNFGHNGPENFWGLGINGKNSELHAAMGLSVLPFVPEIIEYRKNVFAWYAEGLKAVESKFERPVIREGTDYNFAYYPVIFETEAVLLKVMEALAQQGVFGRRYFYPSLNTIEYVQGASMPVSESISTRILCLPLYFGLTKDQVDMISAIIVKTIG